jgi:hypothetical protein
MGSDSPSLASGTSRVSSALAARAARSSLTHRARRARRAHRAHRAGLGVALVAALALALLARPAAAQQCRVVELHLTPTAGLQIVAWLEDAQGAYVATTYVTHAVGMYGIGNRPGIVEFNSGPRWPYGRRETTFPVWAHRHGQSFPAVVFQNSSDTTERDLSHPFGESSLESHFCRPLKSNEPGWDTGTCASTVYTDKGSLSETRTSRYPPRSDVARLNNDHSSVATFRQVNPFDTISRATPAGGVPATLRWTMPQNLPAGNYVMWVEVSKEFDHNSSYTDAMRPPPAVAYGDYGEPYRGQPSVLYRVPLSIGQTQTAAQTDSYFGYGDPDGLDGLISPPDATISTTVAGSGAARLALVPEGGGYRVRVVARPEMDSVAPGTPAAASVTSVANGSLTFTFEAPGEDGATGRVTEYEIRIRAGEPINESNFESSMPVSVSVEPDEPGQQQTVTLSGLLPETHYYVAVRAYDDCRNASPLLLVDAETTGRQAGEVDACFVATAAYGTKLANEVEMLRHFRDAMLSRTVLGQLAVTAYYTFGPTVAGVVGESELLRTTARTALEPVVRRVGGLKQ